MPTYKIVRGSIRKDGKSYSSWSRSNKIELDENEANRIARNSRIKLVRVSGSSDDSPIEENEESMDQEPAIEISKMSLAELGALIPSLSHEDLQSLYDQESGSEGQKRKPVLKALSDKLKKGGSD